MSDFGVAQAKRLYNITLERVSAEDTVFHQRYDVVVLRHVIEHLNDPEPVLRNIRKSGLTEHGVLYMKCPDVGRADEKLEAYNSTFDLPRHRTHFTQDGMRMLLERCGFEHIAIFSELSPQDGIRSHRYATLGSCRSVNYAKLPIFAQHMVSALSTCMHPKRLVNRMIILAK